MIVRAATIRDVDAIVAIGRSMHAGSAHGYVAFNGDHAGAFVVRAVMSNMCYSGVAEHDGKIVGFMIGTMQDWPFLTLKVATDLVVVSTRAGAGSMLYNAFERWAWANGADEISLSMSYGGPSDEHGRAQSLLERKGYEHVGGLFFKRKG